MRRRLYFVRPELAGAEQAICELLLARIDIRATLALPFPPDATTPQLAAVLMTGVVGAITGKRIASVAGAVTPSSRLTSFTAAIAQV